MAASFSKLSSNPRGKVVDSEKFASSPSVLLVGWLVGCLVGWLVGCFCLRSKDYAFLSTLQCLSLVPRKRSVVCLCCV